jgi:hypothetical protein
MQESLELNLCQKRANLLLYCFYFWQVKAATKKVDNGRIGVTCEYIPQKRHCIILILSCNSLSNIDVYIYTHSVKMYLFMYTE